MAIWHSFHATLYKESFYNNSNNGNNNNNNNDKNNDNNSINSNSNNNNNNNNNNDNNNNNNNNNNNKFAWNRHSMWQLVPDIQPLGSKVNIHPNNKIKTRSQNTYHIVRRVGKKGMRLTGEWNKSRVKQ